MQKITMPRRNRIQSKGSFSTRPPHRTHSKKKTSARTSLLEKFERLKQIPLLYWIGSAIFLGLVALSFIIGSSAGDRVEAQPLPPADTSEPQFVSLSAEVSWSNQSFIVRNLSTETWNRCKLEVNAQSFGDGYAALRESIDGGVTVTIPHSEFKQNTGSEYQFETARPTRFMIRCLDVAGKPGVFVGSSS